MTPNQLEKKLLQRLGRALHAVNDARTCLREAETIVDGPQLATPEDVARWTRAVKKRQRYLERAKRALSEACEAWTAHMTILDRTITDWSGSMHDLTQPHKEM